MKNLKASRACHFEQEVFTHKVEGVRMNYRNIVEKTFLDCLRGKKIDIGDLVGAAEIAQRLNVKDAI
jgi:hypothetical protein